MLQRDVGAVTSYAEAVAGGYTGTRTQWRTLLASLPKEPFIATYDTTTYQQVLTAWQGEQWPVAIKGSTVLPMVQNNGSFDTIYFGGIIGDKSIQFRLTSSGWAYGELRLAQESSLPTKTSDLSNDSGFITSSDLPPIPADASEVPYDNTDSGLEATDVQGAIDELASSGDSGIMIVTATATWDSSQHLEGLTITSGQTQGDVYMRARGDGGVILVVDRKIYRLDTKPSGTTLSGTAVFMRTDGESCEAFSLTARTASGSMSLTYTWTYAKTQIQTTDNLVTSISSSSTDAQYPSAKCVYDLVGDVESLLADI